MPTLMMVLLVLTTASLSITSQIVDPIQTSWTARAANTMDKLHTVEMRLTGFMIANGRLPCPADGQYPEQTQYFGVEAGVPGTCTGGTPAAPLGPDNATGYIVGGTIPTRALHLGDEYGFDEWGHRITYVVDKRATKFGTCQTLEGLTPSNGTPTGYGSIKIESATGGTVLDNVMHAFIVHGPSGHGAWPIQGSSTTLTSAQSVARRINAGAHDADENANVGWSNDGNYTYSTANWTNVKVMKDLTAASGTDTGFDQIVYYAPYQKNLCCLGPNCQPLGFRFIGNWGNGYVGGVAYGDINGDGISDLVINTQQGMVYVLFGNASGFSSPLDPTALTGSPAGFVLTGFDATYGLGVAVGHVTSQTYNDIVVFPSGSRHQGAYVLYGGPGPRTGVGTWAASWPASVNISSFTGTAYGFFIPNHGNWADQYSTGGTVGDINGDGYDDVIIGVPRYNNGGKAGWVDVVFGGPGPKTGTGPDTWAANWSSTFDTTTLNGTNGFEVHPVDDTTGYYFGDSLAVGDLNGDGVKDLAIMSQVVGDVGHMSDIYVLFGHTGAWAASLNAGTDIVSPNGTVFTNAGFDFWNWGQMAFVNLLGHSGTTQDLILSNWVRYRAYADPAFAQLIPGHTGAWASSSTVAAAATVSFAGPSTSSYVGQFVASAGDVNGDGIPDVIFGASNDSASGLANSGSAYVVFGSSSLSGTFNVTTSLNGSNGFRVDGPAANYYVGTGVGGIDLTNDGHPEVIIGAVYTAPNGVTNAGTVYGLWGKTTWKTPISLSPIP